MSASGCRMPHQPTRYGPRRCCEKAATLRSASTSTAAEICSAKNTTWIRTM